MPTNNTENAVAKCRNVNIISWHCYSIWLTSSNGTQGADDGIKSKLQRRHNVATTHCSSFDNVHSPIVHKQPVLIDLVEMRIRQVFLIYTHNLIGTQQLSTVYFLGEFPPTKNHAILLSFARAINTWWRKRRAANALTMSASWDYSSCQSTTLQLVHEVETVFVKQSLVSSSTLPFTKIVDATRVDGSVVHQHDVWLLFLT